MRILLLSFVLVILSACASLPAPKNANGTINPSVAVGEAEVAYINATSYATSYVTACHADMTIVGCKATIITALKSANDKALASLFAAEAAVRKLSPTATTGAEQQIATAQADTTTLATLTPKH